MRRKNLSKRRWRSRMMLGLWIPDMIIEAYGFTIPNGYVGEAHPELCFYRITKCATMTA